MRLYTECRTSNNKLICRRPIKDRFYKMWLTFAVKDKAFAVIETFKIQLRATTVSAVFTDSGSGIRGPYSR